MNNSVIRFVLDSFSHYMPEDKVEDFVRGLVGKRVLLMPDDDNPYDKDCVEGYYAGRPCCHVSARKASTLRQVMQQEGRRSLMVVVSSHNLETGFKTVFCQYEPAAPLSDDFLAERSRAYLLWHYLGSAQPVPCRYRSLLANTDYLLERLGADDVTAEEVLPIIAAYLEDLPVAFAREDKENCISVNAQLQNSTVPAIRACNAQLVVALDHLNHPERREDIVRQWLAELKQNRSLRLEAEGLDGEAWAQREANLRAFPDGLYEGYRRDFTTFCGNLYYNDIPAEALRAFMSGVALCDLAAARLAGTTERRQTDFDHRRLDKLESYLATHHPGADDLAAIIAEHENALSDEAARQRLLQITERFTQPEHRPTTQNIIYPQQGSTANIGCDQQHSDFQTLLPTSAIETTQKRLQQR